MAEIDRASPRRVRLSYDDHEWLAKLAQDENLSVRAMVKRAVRHFRLWLEQGQPEHAHYEAERHLRRHYQRKYEMKSRRLHEAVLDLRNLRATYESQLSDERELRAKRETKLRDERDFYKRRARAAEADRNVLGSPTVAKLLTLALRSDSYGEAVTALEKARSLHRKERYSAHPDL